MPPALASWSYDDMTSDAGFSLFAFVGFGVIYQRSASAIRNANDHRNRQSCFDADRNAPMNAVTCLDLHWMSQYEVRADFERYGATAYFDGAHNPVAIYRPAANAEKDNFRDSPDTTKSSNGTFTYHQVLISTPGDANWDHFKWVIKVSYCLLLTTYYLLLTTHYSLLTTYYSLLTTHYSLLTAYYLLLTTYYLLLATYYSLLTTYFSLLFTYCLLLSTYC